MKNIYPEISKSLLKKFLFTFLTVIMSLINLSAQSLLDADDHPKFVNPLPTPPVIDATSGGLYNISITEFYQNLGLVDENNNPLMTKVWGYNGTYPGPTFVTRKNVPIEVYWNNNLVDANSNPLSHLLPVDTSIHWALGHHTNWEMMGVPIVTHLHGGHTESASDGLPEAWYTPGFTDKGHDFVKGDIAPYYYQNDQEAATLWYHDHALGITRLNVYAGLAGFYLLRDEREDILIANNSIPSGPYEKGIVIQDRMFTEDGQLYYPAMHEMSGSPDPSVMPESFGEFILVNGMAWPVMDVEPRSYRFRLLNGSDSRFYNLFFSDPVKISQIGTDNGLLPSPIPLNQVLISPGERYDLIVDFSSPSLRGKTIILKNNARTPFPNGDTPDNKTTGTIMAFRVNVPLNPTYPITSLPASLRPSIQPLTQTGATRQLILFEGNDEYGRLRPQLGTASNGVMLWDDAITENPQLNDVETWEVFNLTEDAHPIHLHLVSYQLLNRQKFTAVVDETTAAISNVQLIGNPKQPKPGERGWKDTAIMYPGEVTRIRAKFDVEGLYVWHCHILSHEDHEMMRPYYVGDMGGMMRIANNEQRHGMNQNFPNPATDKTTIYFHLDNSSYANINLFDISGKYIATLTEGHFTRGEHSVEIQTSSFARGIYTYSLQTEKHTITRKMVIQ